MSCGCSSRRTSSCSTSLTCGSSCSCQAACTDTCDVICAALVVTNAWNVPACDEEAILYIPGLTSALIGSYISNPSYGTFKITGINSVGGKLTIMNECLDGNVAPGTVVPAGTQFVFGTPPTLTEYVSWTPVVTASGAMTVSGLTISTADYFTIGTTVFFNLTLLFTLGGVADILVEFSLPLEGAPDDAQNGWPANVADNSGPQPGSAWRVYESDGTKGIVFLPAVVNWTLGAGASISIQGRYQLA